MNPKSATSAPLIEGVPDAYIDENATKTMNVGNRVLNYVASAPAKNDPRLVSDYYQTPEPRVVTARILNKDTGVFEMRAVGARTFRKKNRTRK